MKKTFLISILSLMFLSACSPQSDAIVDQHPVENGDNNYFLTEAEAKLIAEKSCIKGGDALGAGTYNANTHTWWFDANLNTTRPGCSPACVVYSDTETAEINWRCTGAIEPENEAAAKPDNKLTKIGEDEHFDRYAGTIILSGKYREYNEKNVLGNILCFYPDENSKAPIPREEGDERDKWFCFDDQENAKTLFGINDEEAFANPSDDCLDTWIEGEATVEISNYAVLTLVTEGSDEAKLERVISKKPYSKACSDS